MTMNDFRDLPDKGMKLATFAEEVSDGQVLVRWWVGVRNHGSLKVSTPKNSENAAVIGELTAIGYLLFEEKIFNRDVVSGRGIYLYVSKGATKKVAKGKARSSELSKYGTYFRHQLNCVSIEVKNQYRNLQKPNQLAYHLDRAIEAFPVDYSLVETPAMGVVKITKHAIDRLVERTTAGQPKNPWLSLTRMIKNPELEKKRLTPNVIEQKRKKYGNRQINEVWGHPSSNNEFIIAADKQKRTLVSFYDASVRDQKELQM